MPQLPIAYSYQLDCMIQVVARFVKILPVPECEAFYLRFQPIFVGDFMPIVRASHSITPLRVAKWIGIVFTFWIGWLILTPFPFYIPPNFEKADFLRPKSDFFYNSGYFIGFFAHIVGAPICLMLGGFQMSRSIRDNRPAIHRRLGQIYVAVALLLAAPGGLIMAMKSYGGLSSVICFGSIAILTWWSTFTGWKAGREYDVTRHRRWMMRSYILILSAVFLRLTHFLLSHFQMDQELTYQLSAWISWLLPLAVLELAMWFGRPKNSFSAD